MKNWFYVIGGLMLLLIAAYFTMPKEDIQSASIPIPQENPVPLPKEKPYVAEGYIPEKIFEDNLHYYYSKVSLEDRDLESYVKGTKMKSMLSKPKFNQKKQKYDTIYFDTQSKNAVAYCENRYNNCDSKGPFFIVYSEVYVMTPNDWLSSINQEKVVRSEFVRDRKSTLIEFNYNDNLVKIWLDENNAMPNKIQVLENNVVIETYYYTYIDFDLTKDTDVLPS